MIRQSQIKLRKVSWQPETEYLWVGIHREHSYNDQLNTAVSQLLICPGCCQIWADLWFEGDNKRWPVAQTCEHCSIHDDWMPVPGSLLVEEGWGVIDDSLLNALPPDLLRREFDLHMRYLGNEQVFLLPPEGRVLDNGQSAGHTDRQDGLEGVGGADLQLTQLPEEPDRSQNRS